MFATSANFLHDLRSGKWLSTNERFSGVRLGSVKRAGVIID